MGQEAGRITSIFHVKSWILTRTTGGIFNTFSHSKPGCSPSLSFHPRPYRTYKVGLTTQPNTPFHPPGWALRPYPSVPSAEFPSPVWNISPLFTPLAWQLALQPRYRRGPLCFANWAIFALLHRYISYHIAKHGPAITRSVRQHRSCGTLRATFPFPC